MKNQDMDSIRSFIASIESKYGELLEIGYEFDELSQLHYVWHTNKLLEDQDKGFRRFVGGLILDIYDAGIYNFCFSYDRERAKLMSGVDGQIG